MDPKIYNKLIKEPFPPKLSEVFLCDFDGDNEDTAKNIKALNEIKLKKSLQRKLTKWKQQNQLQATS